MEDVYTLHKLEQGLPKGQLPPAEDRSDGGFHSRAQAPDLYGRILKVQLDKISKGRPGENCLHHHKLRALLLQGDAFRVEKYKSNLPKVSKQDVQ